MVFTCLGLFGNSAHLSSGSWSRMETHAHLDKLRLGVLNRAGDALPKPGKTLEAEERV